MSDQAAEPKGSSREGALLYRRAIGLLATNGIPLGNYKDGAITSTDDALRTLPANRALQEHDTEGVNLLVKAVRSGHEQAKIVLTDLLKSGRGIGLQNLVEVIYPCLSNKSNPSTFTTGVD